MTVYDILGATCISDAVIVNAIILQESASITDLPRSVMEGVMIIWRYSTQPNFNLWDQTGHSVVAEL